MPRPYPEHPRSLLYGLLAGCAAAVVLVPVALSSIHAPSSAQWTVGEQHSFQWMNDVNESRQMEWNATVTIPGPPSSYDTRASLPFSFERTYDWERGIQPPGPTYEMAIYVNGIFLFSGSIRNTLGASMASRVGEEHHSDWWTKAPYREGANEIRLVANVTLVAEPWKGGQANLTYGPLLVSQEELDQDRDGIGDAHERLGPADSRPTRVVGAIAFSGVIAGVVVSGRTWLRRS